VRVTPTPDAPTEVQVQLEPGRTIRGIVLDPDGEPVSGAALLVARSVRLPWKRLVKLRTDEQGRFEWLSAPDRAVLFTVYRRGFVPTASRLTPRDESHFIKLKPVEAGPRNGRRPGYDPFKIFRSIS